MGTICVLNAIYTLIEHTHLSTSNSKQSVIKNQSQERAKKSKKTCLQPLLVKSYVAKVLPFHFFWHSLLLILLLFPCFSHVIVQWVSFHFFVVYTICYDDLNSLSLVGLSLFLCFKGLCLIAKSWAVSSFRMRHDLLSFPKTRIVWNRIYYLCTKNNNQYSKCFAFDCPIQIELLCVWHNNKDKQLPLGTGLLQKFEAGTGIDWMWPSIFYFRLCLGWYICRL